MSVFSRFVNRSDTQFLTVHSSLLHDVQTWANIASEKVKIKRIQIIQGAAVAPRVGVYTSGCDFLSRIELRGCSVRIALWRSRVDAVRVRNVGGLLVGSREMLPPIRA